MAVDWACRALRCAPLVLVTAALVSASSGAQRGGAFYVTGEGGLLANATNLEPVGFVLGAGGGYRLPTRLPLRLQADFVHSRLDLGYAAGRARNLFGTLALDWANATRWTPYVGGGAGASWAQARVLGLLDIADRGWCFQVVSGVDYRFTKSLSAGPKVRWLTVRYPLVGAFVSGMGIVVNVKYRFPVPASARAHRHP